MKTLKFTRYLSCSQTRNYDKASKALGVETTPYLHPVQPCVAHRRHLRLASQALDGGVPKWVLGFQLAG